MSSIFLILSFIACGDKTEDSGSDTTTSGFEGGTFQFTSNAVNDQCLDGGFEALFLPEGAGSTKDWQYTIELPNEADMPSTYNIQLQDPFSEMEVTVSTPSEGVLEIEEATQAGVLFDGDNYADCYVDLSVQATMNVVDADNLSGQATMSVVSSTGETCPAFSATPCNIILDFTAARQ